MIQESHTMVEGTGSAAEEGHLLLNTWSAWHLSIVGAQI